MRSYILAVLILQVAAVAISKRLQSARAHVCLVCVRDRRDSVVTVLWTALCLHVQARTSFHLCVHKSADYSFTAGNIVDACFTPVIVCGAGVCEPT